MTDQEKAALSEDPNAGLATPIMDLMAACVIGAIALWLAIESIRLPIPGDLITAPGLLPFLTSGSLLVMCWLLAMGALRRKQTMAPDANRFELPAEFRQSVLLGVIMIVYVAGLQFLPVAAAFRLGAVRLVIGNFEVTTLLVLTTILRIFWQRALWQCLAVAFGWTAFLSLIFRLIFEIRLP